MVEGSLFFFLKPVESEMSVSRMLLLNDEFNVVYYGYIRM